jgi:uncharacterized protein YdaL
MKIKFLVFHYNQVYNSLIKSKNKDVRKYSRRNDYDQVMALSEKRQDFIDKYFSEITESQKKVELIQSE